MKKQKKNKILVKVMKTHGKTKSSQSFTTRKNIRLMKMRYLYELDNLFSHLMENFKVLKW